MFEVTFLNLDINHTHVKRAHNDKVNSYVLAGDKKREYMLSDTIFFILINYL